MPFLDRIGRAVHVHVPPAGGVLHAGARRRRSARSTASGRRPCSSPATSPTTRSATSSTLALDDAARRRRVDARQRRARLRRRAGRRTPPTPSTTAPTTTRPPTRARSQRAQRPFQRRRASTRRGTRWSATTTCSRRARSRPRRRSTRSPPATGSSRALDPEIVDSRRATRSIAKQAVAAAALATSPRSTRSDVPADPTRRLVAPGEAERRARPRAWTTPSTSGRDVRAILVDTVNRDGTLAGAHHAGAARHGCARNSRSREPLGRRLLPQPADRRGARRPRRTPARRRRDRRQLAPQPHPRARPLLADQHLARSPTSPSRRACSACARRPRGVALETWMVDHDGRGLAGDLARARLPRRAGRPPPALRRRAPRIATRGSSFQRRNRNTCRSPPFHAAVTQREEKYVNTRAFLGACRCPEPRRRMP